MVEKQLEDRLCVCCVHSFTTMIIYDHVSTPVMCSVLWHGIRHGTCCRFRYYLPSSFSWCVWPHEFDWVKNKMWTVCCILFVQLIIHCVNKPVVLSTLCINVTSGFSAVFVVVLNFFKHFSSPLLFILYATTWSPLVCNSWCGWVHLNYIGRKNAGVDMYQFC